MLFDVARVAVAAGGLCKSVDVRQSLPMHKADTETVVALDGSLPVEGGLKAITRSVPVPSQASTQDADVLSVLCGWSRRTVA
jgi:hypothetical protein